MEFIIQMLHLLVELYSFLLLANALLSWVPGVSNSPVGRLLDELVEPVLKPFRRFNLIFFGLDWTPVVVVVLLRVAVRYLSFFLAFLL